MSLLVWVCLVHGLAAVHAARIAMFNHHDDLPPIDVEPRDQHVPLTTSWRRPPPPRLPDTPTVFVGLASFRDGHRCGHTLLTGFARATFPSRVRFGIVDQVEPADERCVDAFCALARVAWPNDDACRFRNQITIVTRMANASRGPTLARHHQQALVDDTDEFCLQLDAHSVFSRHWDVHLVHEWSRANNEMAILTTYLHAWSPAYVSNLDGANNPPNQFPHLCSTTRGQHGCVRTAGASMLLDAERPQLTALWGAGLSFSKCHAERRVRVDPKTLWLFDGEEILRASHLWTHGYDFYSPSISVIYHNYTPVPVRFEAIPVDAATRHREVQLGLNRYKLALDLPVDKSDSPVDRTDLDLYAHGTVRSLVDYLAFAGIDLVSGHDNHTCKQLHWQPYQDPSPIEALLPGWTMDIAPTNAPVVVVVPAVMEPRAPEMVVQGTVAIPHNLNDGVIRQGKVHVQGNNVQARKQLHGVPYHVHVMIVMIAMLAGLFAFVVHANRKAKRQLKKFVVQ
ncbi:Aste57867_11847 [Aphanomyces stellatus]|uniref:Aste57867_11847 protein n=1 Tax=Aphanomyces stellatus TaxID=120398 RepID=A0A485KU28_9STRA|nr:hypothetical protein As57867_011802 [Aphanomyces stellatus]VFT88702.1 Aste57867_11847 [Aphanomyces stellatus]